VLNVPLPQAVHARFVVAEHAVEAYVPGLHDAQLVQLVAFVVVLNVPLAQLPHVRSAVALPAPST
jgi:hypothetical protein